MAVIAPEKPLNPFFAYGERKPDLGLSAHSRCNGELGSPSGAHDDHQHSETQCHRTGTRADPENDMERVLRSTLGSNHCERFLYRRGVDVFGFDALRGFVLYGSVD